MIDLASIRMNIQYDLSVNSIAFMKEDIGEV